MDELARRLASLREGVVPSWTEARSERLYAGASKLRRRRDTRKLVTYTVGPVAAAAVVVLCLRLPALLSGDGTPAIGARSSANSELSASQKHEQSGVGPTAHVPDALLAGARLKLADGSHVEVTSSAGELFVRRDERDDVDLRLAAGSAHFEVVPNASRRFSVVAGSVEVIVVGTVFDVERAQGRVRVAVSHGKVRVRSAAGVALVEAGASNWFEDSDARSSPAGSSPEATSPGAPIGPEAATPPGAAVKVRAGRGSQSKREEPARADWRSLSQSGDYEAAYRLIAQGSPVGDDPESLMDAADTARLSNHDEEAARYLRKVLQGRRGPTTPLAAFTLGRVLLERLGRPSEAADAFALARELAPRESLAQDSLAREVEAWSKAGHTDKANERARLYAEQYPEGRRLRAVQLYGGLHTR